MRRIYPVPAMRGPARAGELLQRKQTPGQRKPWLPELNEILPKGVGLLTHIFRVTTLVDIFGTKPLEEHVRLIHSDAQAKSLSINHGVPGIVALYDTRAGARLDVTAARKALKTSKARYRHSSLKSLRLVPGEKAILTPKQREALAKRKKAERAKRLKEQREIRRQKKALAASYNLAGVVDGDASWSKDHLQQVSDAFKLVPAGDRKALEGVVLKRVASLGGSTAGRFRAQQSVTGTTVTNEATLELADLAFAKGAPDSHGTIVHEVGHAVASLRQRTTTHAEHEAIAASNRQVDVSNAASEAFVAAQEERNTTVDPLNAAARAYNAALRSRPRDKARVAATRRTYLAAKKAYDTKKAEEDRLKAIWKKELKKTKAAERRATAKGRTARAARISSSKLKSIKARAVAAKKVHDARLGSANKSAVTLTGTAETESRAYVSSVREASTAIEQFAQRTAGQTIAEDTVETAVEVVRKKISDRNARRGGLATKNKSNPALPIFARLERAQDAWFESAAAHSLAHQRSARVERFVAFVRQRKITPRTVYPPQSYAEENWPHKPEEFYAEVYSMFVVKPNTLKARSKALHQWFKAGKYL